MWITNNDFKNMGFGNAIFKNVVKFVAKLQFSL